MLAVKINFSIDTLTVLIFPYQKECISFLQEKTLAENFEKLKENHLHWILFLSKVPACSLLVKRHDMTASGTYT